MNKRDSNGLKQGYWEHKYSPSLKHIGHYKNGLMYGRWESQLKLSGNNHILCSVRNYSRGLVHGDGLDFYSDGLRVRSKSFYINGFICGLERNYYKNGKIKIKRFHL